MMCKRATLKHRPYIHYTASRKLPYPFYILDNSAKNYSGIRVRWASLQFSGMKFHQDSVHQKLRKIGSFFAELFKI